MFRLGSIFVDKLLAAFYSIKRCKRCLSVFGIRSDRFAEAREFVDSKKQARLLSTASMYLSEHPTGLQPRFDVIEIYAPEGIQTAKPVINHLEDAFQ